PSPAATSTASRCLGSALSPSQPRSNGIGVSLIVPGVIQDPPGPPAIGHLGKAARIVQVLLREGRDRLQVLMEDATGIREYFVELAAAILFKHDGIALILGQPPELGARHRPGVRYPEALLLAPGDVRNDILDRPLSRYPLLGHPRFRDASEQRLP